MKYAKLDKDNNPEAFYSDDVHDINDIPPEAVEIDDATWSEHLEGTDKVYLNGKWSTKVKDDVVRIAEAKLAKKSEVKLSKESFKEDTLKIKSITWGCGVEDFNYYNSKLRLAELSSAAEVSLLDVNSVLQTLSIKEATDVVVSVGNSVFAKEEANKIRLKSIEEATNLADIESI